VKPLYILVEGQTEEEFVKDLLRPFLWKEKIYEIQPIKISTKAGFKGGFVNYEHLRRDATRLLKQRKEVIVSTFVDYFRIPTNLPNYQSCIEFLNIDARIDCLEREIYNDIGHERFLPYIQKHEFEALLFSSNRGFESYFDKSVAGLTQSVIEQYENPEEINDKPQTAPSKRILSFVPEYNKVLDGNIIALEVGFETMLEKCPRFKSWIETIIEKVKV
jgi:hypothetical protein